MNECYYCSNTDCIPSVFQRKVKFDETLFSYYRCIKCNSFSLYPKLNDRQLERLYSLEYISFLTTDNLVDEKISEDQESAKFLDLDNYLRREGVHQGYFLDYGCGYLPKTFELVSALGLTPIGMEFSSDIRADVNEKTGVKVLSKEDTFEFSEEFKYIFLGDVIEHLIEPISDLSILCSKLTKDGCIIAQGPLQSAATLTHAAIKLSAIFRKNNPSAYPPYHVSLASRKSMIRLMEISGFQIIHFRCTETTWPAPNFRIFLSSPNLRNFTLGSLKFLDKCVAKVLPFYGSRYFLVAKKIDPGKAH